MSGCPSCGDHDHDNLPGGCDHAAETDCHRNGLLACPTHFAHISADALEGATGRGTGDQPFLLALRHINADGYTFCAYYTWMALLGRYAVDPGTDREAFLAKIPVELPELPGHAPEYLAAVGNRLSFASRAALINDGATVAATLASVEDMTSEATVSFLMSVAASAHLAVDINDACTSDEVQAYHLLGSQVTEEHGFMALPFLADMVLGQWKGDASRATEAWTELMKLSDEHPKFMAVVVDVVSRTLGQMLSADANLITTGGQRMGEGFIPTGMVDVKLASPENTPPEVMAGVWAARAAEAYAGATSRDDATTRIQAVGEQHPRGRFAFAVDVVLAGTSMLGYALDESQQQDAAGQPGD